MASVSVRETARLDSEYSDADTRVRAQLNSLTLSNGDTLGLTDCSRAMNAISPDRTIARTDPRNGYDVR